MKRQRGRNRRSGNNNNANRSMESNGPDVKVRGTAKQVYEKYESLAQDSMSSGNRVKAENYRQHAEHYLRLASAQELLKQAQREELASAAANSPSDSATGVKEGAKEGTDNKRQRRYPPQARRSEASGEKDVKESKTPESKMPKSKAQESTDQKETSLKAANHDAEAPAPKAAVEAVAPAKSAARRKAPSRASKSEEAAEAAK